MLSRRTQWLLGGLGLVGVLYLLSRTKQGGAAVDSGIALADIARVLFVNAVSSRGYRNHNPGNIKWIEIPARRWRGMIARDGVYAVFDTPQNGTRALGKELLKRDAQGLRTVEGLIADRTRGWAPPGENDSVAYVNDVSLRLDVDADEPLDVAALLPDLAEAIAGHENGYVDSTYNWDWVNLP